MTPPETPPILLTEQAASARRHSAARERGAGGPSITAEMLRAGADALDASAALLQRAEQAEKEVAAARQEIKRQKDYAAAVDATSQGRLRVLLEKAEEIRIEWARAENAEARAETAVQRAEQAEAVIAKVRELLPLKAAQRLLVVDAELRRIAIRARDEFNGHLIALPEPDRTLYHELGNESAALNDELRDVLSPEFVETVHELLTRSTP
jgi:hypothetical protein